MDVIIVNKKGFNMQYDKKVIQQLDDIIKLINEINNDLKRIINNE